MLGRLAIYRLLKAAYLRRGLGAKEWEARTKARVSLDRCPSTMWESSATPTRTSLAPATPRPSSTRSTSRRKAVA